MYVQWEGLIDNTISLLLFSLGRQTCGLMLHHVQWYDERITDSIALLIVCLYDIETYLETYSVSHTVSSKAI